MLRLLIPIRVGPDVCQRAENAQRNHAPPTANVDRIGLRVIPFSCDTAGQDPDNDPDGDRSHEQNDQNDECKDIQHLIN